MSAEMNKAVVRRLHQALDRGDLAAIDTHPGLIAEFKPMYVAMSQAFAGITITSEQLVAEGDWVGYHLTVRATQTGEWAGVPNTGREVEFAVDGMYQVSGGTITGGFGQADLVRHLHELRTATAA